MMFRLLLAIVFAAYSLAFESVAPENPPSYPVYETLTGSPDPNSAGIRVRLMSKGLDYINGLAGQQLQNEATKISIPSFSIDISKGLGSGKVTAWDVRIVSFHKPEIYSKLSEPNRVAWETEGGSATVTGRWNGNYKVLINYKFGGTFTVKVKDIKFKMASLVTQGSTHRPELNVTGCEAAVGDLDLEISGGIVGWFANQFSGSIKQAIRDSLKDTLCKQTVGLNVAANQEFGKQPIAIPLNKNYSLNYELCGDPVVTPDYIDSIHRGEISLYNEGGTPFTPHPIPQFPRCMLQRMLHLYYSDFVMNSFLHSAFHHNETQFLLNPQNTPNLTPFLRTTCPQNSCIGEAFHNIGLNFPDKMVSVDLWASQMPNVTIEDDRANMRVILEGSVFIEDPVFSNVTDLADFWMDFSGELQFRVEGIRLVGEFVSRLEDHYSRLIIATYEDAIGDVTSSEVEMIHGVLNRMLQTFVNSQFKHGFPIQTLDNMEFVNPEVRLFRRTLEIATDIRSMLL